MSSPTAVSARLTDDELLDRAAGRVAVPKHEPGDSFVLHAPLELLARRALLSVAHHGDRDGIRARVDSVAAEYAAWGTAIERRPRSSPAIATDPVGVLLRSIADRDSEGVDDAIAWMARHLDVDEFADALAGPVLPSLAAAAHGSIFLYLLPRVAARSLPAAAMARSTVHELARYPDLSLTWFEHGLVDAAPDAPGRLAARLERPLLSEQPENHFIYPTMSVTERTGLAADILADLVGGLTVRSARHVLLRVAAHSMLQDDPAHAPYGWSHCLTMPQATLGVAHRLVDRAPAIAVAATYVLGFRASLGSHHVGLDWTPDRPDAVGLGELLDVDPATAAAAVWHADPADRPAIWRHLAGHAGAHHDAHLAKYTLACLDATRADPDAEHLFQSAAAFLNAWWVDAERSPTR